LTDRLTAVALFRSATGLNTFSNMRTKRFIGYVYSHIQEGFSCHEPLLKARLYFAAFKV
jgi:hypothetical protein